MKEVILVAIGGALGALGRFKLSSAFSWAVIGSAIPLSIVIVNTVGCLAAGLLLGLTERFNFFSSDARVFLFAGVLGGFTTFSAFGVETLTLLRSGSWGSAIAYVCLSVGLGIVAVVTGFVSVKP